MDKLKTAGLKTICLDFDGVIHQHRSGWQGPGIIADGVVPGIAEAIEKLREDFEVKVYSSRCRWEEGRAAIEVKLAEWNIVVDGVSEFKPAALVYVDDRGVRFDGDPQKMLDDIIRVLSIGTWVDRENRQ